MPRGSPDYGNADNQVSLAITDNSEVVAATKTLTRLDGRGRIIFWDNFANGLNNWVQAGVYTGASINFYAGTDRNLGQYPPVEFRLPSAAHSPVMFKTIMTTGVKRIGIELGVMVAYQSGEFQVQLSANNSDGAKRIGILFIKEDTGVISINQGGSKITLYTPPDMNLVRYKWMLVKMVVNVEESIYERVIIGGHEFDVSSYTLSAGASGTKGEIQAAFIVSGKSVVYYQPCYISHVIITVDEP